MYSTQGIIVKREDFRERDERIFLYTKDFGKISVVAKGVKRIEAKLRGSVDIFNFVDIIFVEGKYFFILTGIDIRERFPNIINKPYLYSAALSAAGTIASIFEENLPTGGAGARDREIFDAFHFTIKKLNEYGRAELAPSPAELDGRDESDPSPAELAGGNGTPNNCLYSWLILKKFQMTILENQGYGSTYDTNHLSKSSLTLLEMLKGSPHKNVRLSRKDFLSIEEFFGNMFANFFNHRLSLWVPEV